MNSLGLQGSGPAVAGAFVAVYGGPSPLPPGWEMSRPGLRLASLCSAFLTGAAPLAVAAPECVLPPPRFPDGPLRGAGDGRPVLPAGGVVRGSAPSQGNVHVLVLLAEFADLPHRIAPSRFADHLFGPGPSLRTYYQEMSGGRLDVTGDIHGWFPLPRAEVYYSSGNGGVGTYPNNGQRMAEDAVAAAVAAGVSLADYDADGDGTVDVVLVVHSGEGLEWAGSTNPALTPFPDPYAINSHKWVVVDGDAGPGLPRVADYFTGPEMQRARPILFPAWTDSIAGIGVFCHEFGHVLGLPDFYDTQTAVSRIGAWEIMDAGTWTYVPSDPPHSLPGSLPARLSAWSKALLGWSAPELLAPGSGEVLQASFVLQAAGDGGTALQLRANPFGVDWRSGAAGTGEYFLAEVRTREGWDAGLPAEGLLLYHVDETRAGNRASDYADGAGLLLLVPQDGNVDPAQDDTDPWPGPADAFGAASSPSSALHDGSGSGVEITGIAVQPTGAVSLTASVSNLASEVALPFARPHPFRPATHGTAGLVLTLDASGAPATRVRMFDLRGRPVRVLDAPDEFAASGRVAVWDGRDDGGNALPSGVYFFRADGGAAGRVVLLRE